MLFFIIQNKCSHLFLILYSLFVFLFNEHPPKTCKVHILQNMDHAFSFCLEHCLIICSGKCRFCLGISVISVFISELSFLYYFLWIISTPLAGQVISLKPREQGKKKNYYDSLLNAVTSTLLIYSFCLYSS